MEGQGKENLRTKAFFVISLVINLNLLLVFNSYEYLSLFPVSGYGLLKFSNYLGIFVLCSLIIPFKK